MYEYPNQVRFFKNIPADFNKDRVIARLGYRANATKLDQVQEKLLEEGICRTIAACNIQGTFGRFKLLELSEKRIIMHNGGILESEGLSKLLKDSDEVVLMAATVGSEIIEEIRWQVEHGDAALGVVMDSVASQIADGAVAWIMNFVGKLLEREGKKTTKHRYSPGFGDLHLASQKVIFQILELERLELSLTERYMLVPEKSVIAIAGVEKRNANI